jgi:hypothetical protein
VVSTLPRPRLSMSGDKPWLLIDPYRLCWLFEGVRMMYWLERTFDTVVTDRPCYSNLSPMSNFLSHQESRHGRRRHGFWTASWLTVYRGEPFARLDQAFDLMPRIGPSLPWTKLEDCQRLLCRRGVFTAQKSCSSVRALKARGRASSSTVIVVCQ